MKSSNSNSIKTIEPRKHLTGAVEFRGDKSISHRYAMLAAIAEGRSEIYNFSTSADCQSTLSCLEKLGARIHRKVDSLTIEGAGLRGLRAPESILDAGNSGSTMRMLSGILAAQPFRSVLSGDGSLSRRPMKRIIDPLTKMGARIQAAPGGLPPLEIEGGALHPIQYELPVASAQVKTAVLLAGLFTEGQTSVIEPLPTRDHTEIALEQMGAKIVRNQKTITLSGPARLAGKNVQVPGDISSAAFFLVAALLVPGSSLTLRHLGLNPTRTGLLDVLLSMGACIRVIDRRVIHGEPTGDLQVESSQLEGGEIPNEIIPGLIDELPVLSVLGTQTTGGLSFHGAAELRVKESDRLKAVAENLRRMGAEVKEFPDGLYVAGGQKLHGAEIETYSDHRIAMAFAVAGLFAEGATVIHDSACVGISFPNFFDEMKRISE
ncbi:MAG: 3-phosphoshikimate 1-carboxyvinyltransferase [Terriglobia bacterium]